MDEELTELNHRFNLEWCAARHCDKCEFADTAVCLDPEKLTPEDIDKIRAALDGLPKEGK